MNNKIIIISALLFFTLMCSGCLENDTLAGSTYVGPDGATLRFFDDGKVHCMKSTGTGALGVYTIEDSRVYINCVFLTWDADIVGDELINKVGEEYIMVKQ